MTACCLGRFGTIHCVREDRRVLSADNMRRAVKKENRLRLTCNPDDLICGVRESTLRYSPVRL